jgi:outer membrane protein TolC
MKSKQYEKLSGLYYAALITLFGVLTIWSTAHAQGDSQLYAKHQAADARKTIPFDHVWKVASAQSTQMLAVQQDAQAQRYASDRSGRHWFPRVYLTGRAVWTNDALGHLMANLGQREVGAADFAPTVLNHPGGLGFRQGSLGVDLPLFEGGQKYAVAKAQTLFYQASQNAVSAAQSQLYADLVKAYGQLISLEHEQLALEQLQAKVKAIIERYGIGSKSNPVGYSGLLGLKNLGNRLQGLILQNQAEQQQQKSALEVMTGPLHMDWRVSVEDVTTYLKRVMPGFERVNSVGAGKDMASSADGHAPSDVAAVRAATLQSDGLAQLKDAERARYLPKLGVFVQGDLTNGERNTATSYTGGAYMQWNLISVTDWGAIGEAEARAAAARYRAETLRLQMQRGAVAAESGVNASMASLQLLGQSSQLLDEQTQTARRLFLNGSINALQLVEVLARRADLISDKKQTEVALLNAATQKFVFKGLSAL